MVDAFRRLLVQCSRFNAADHDIRARARLALANEGLDELVRLLERDPAAECQAFHPFSFQHLNEMLLVEASFPQRLLVRYEIVPNEEERDCIAPALRGEGLERLTNPLSRFDRPRVTRSVQSPKVDRS